MAATAMTGHYDLDSLSKLGPVATALAAVLALLVGAGTVWQKVAADRREQWWKRTEWALSWAYPEGQGVDGDRSQVGAAALLYQSRSSLAGEDEARFLRGATEVVLHKYSQLVQSASESGIDLDFVLDDDPAAKAHPSSQEAK